jgi:hypothetical protein
MEEEDCALQMSSVSESLKMASPWAVGRDFDDGLHNEIESCWTFLKIRD